MRIHFAFCKDSIKGKIMALTISKKKSTLPLLAFLISVSFTPQAFAREDNLDDLLALDLESLANVEISVASKKTEGISDAPGIISVITREKIDQFGGENLLDIFNRIPSMQVSGSTFVPNNVVSLRGQSNQHYANRILFLINGRPFRDATAGGWNIPLFTQFPLSNVEQIEVIRGPGSVLYGTNAFSGVVNIITRKAKKDETAEVSMTYGSFHHKQFQGRAAYAGEDWSVVAALNKTEKDGETISFFDETRTFGSYKMAEGSHGLSLFATIGNLTLQSFTSHTSQPNIGPNQQFPVSDLDIKREFINGGYTHDLWGDWSAEANIGFNRIELVGPTGDKLEDDALLGEVTVQGPIFNTIDLTFGGTFETFDGKAVENFQDHWNSQYVQLEWQPINWLKLVGGMQRNDSEHFKVGYSPRAGAIFTPHEKWGAKLLYGQAFRAASATEAFFTIENVITPDSLIAPETIATLEGQIYYNGNASKASATIYRSRIEDIIGRISNPSGPGLLITNTGVQTFKGIEFEGNKELGGGWSLQGSANFQYGKDDTDLNNPTFYPNWMVKAGVLYKADQWSFGIFNSTFGDPEDIRSADPSVLEVNPQAKGYSLLSANLNLDVNKFANLKNAPDIVFTLHGENLLDEDIHFPDFNRKNVNSFPADAGRTMFGRVTLRF